jgi:hypothetical protein
VTTTGGPLGQADADRPTKPPVAWPVRRAVGTAALVAFAASAAVCLLSFLPGAPTATFGTTVASVAFIVAFPAWTVTVVDHLRRHPEKQSHRNRHGEPWDRRNPMALVGWRKRVVDRSPSGRSSSRRDDAPPRNGEMA